MVSSPCRRLQPTERGVRSTCAGAARRRRRRRPGSASGREAKIHAFSGVALALAIERLMLTKLLEQDHRQQIGASVRPRGVADGEGASGWVIVSAIRGMEKSARIIWISFPLTRDNLERLRDVLAELRQLGRAAARAALRRRDHLRASTRWQMISGNGFRAGRLRAKDLTVMEGFVVRRRAHLRPRWPSTSSSQFLNWSSSRAVQLGARSVNRAPQLFDLKIGDARSARAPAPVPAMAATAHAFSAAASVRAAISAGLSTRRRCRPEARKDRRPRITLWNHKIPGRLRRPFLRFFSRFFSLSGRRRTPCLLRHAPIDARTADRKAGPSRSSITVPSGQRWPQESPALQSL